MTLKVIGAGFGRTGTASMKAALEQLGFGQCYHMREAFKHPEHAAVWRAAAQGQPIDWDQLLAGYQSTTDWPGCTFYRELMERYPEAKVILNVRDPEKWYASAHNTIYLASQGGGLLDLLLPRVRIIRQMVGQLIWQGTFHNQFSDKAYAIDVFNRHNAEVERSVPPERLLVYDVKQGWEPLCTFLGVPVPTDVPFPRLNDSAQFKRVIKMVRLAQLGAVGGLLALLLGAGWLGLRWRVGYRRSLAASMID